MSPRKARGGRPHRKASRDAVRRDILVFVEGRVTEEDYLVHWHRRHRGRVNVKVDEFRGGPLQLVEHAVAARKTGEREARRNRGKAYDEIWCIFDIDTHPHVAQASDLANANGINLAISNPCIELWFVLHFQDQTAFIERRAAQSLARDLLGCEKSLGQAALETLEAGTDHAKRRAQQLDVKHLGDGSPAGSNPSSGVWRLVDSIRSA